MSDEFYRRAKQLFCSALEVASEERDAYLARECADDATLREEVAALLALDSAAESFLAPPERPGDLAADDDVEAPGLGEGSRVGSYVIVKTIGHGGMGAVYLARRADPELPGLVALKVVRRGMDSTYILRRFRTERRILAALEHPNIARFLDGGATADGMPFFVMEYIEGEHILDYCDHRNLPTRARLELFRTVCAAIQYAHTHLVVHRDIKPSNILVTPAGVPYLLDFGIAKLLHVDSMDDASTSGTATGLGILTPEYASPEQVRGERITTASDVYSLGVLLYQLLTGHRPYGAISRAPHEIERAVCEVEPEHPSVVIGKIEETRADDGSVMAQSPDAVSRTRDGTPRKLRRALAGDLDTIIMGALRKEPERRYASVEHFADDIRRHLAGLPVLAHRDSVAYRTSKFIRRHRVGVAAAAVVAASLVAGVIATTWQARVARLERARAERRFSEVRALAHSFLFEFHDAIKDLAGATPARELLVKRALEYLDRLAKESTGDPSLQIELVQAYIRLGDVQGSIFSGNRGDTLAARNSYEKAAALLDSIENSREGRMSAPGALADCYVAISIACMSTGEAGRAVGYARKAVILQKALTSSLRDDRQQRRKLGTAQLRLGRTLREAGSTAQALDATRAAEKTLGPLCNENPADVLACRQQAIAYNQMASIQVTVDAAAARANHGRALAIQTRLAPLDPTNVQLKRELAATYSDMATSLAEMGDLEGAARGLRVAASLFEELVVAEPRSLSDRTWLADCKSDLAWIEQKMGEIARARSTLLAARGLLEGVTTTDPGNYLANRILAIVYGRLGTTYVPEGREIGEVPRQDSVAACSWFQRSAQVYRVLAARGTLNAAEAHDFDKIRTRIVACEAALDGRTRGKF